MYYCNIAIILCHVCKYYFCDLSACQPAEWLRFPSLISHYPMWELVLCWWCILRSCTPVKHSIRCTFAKPSSFSDLNLNPHWTKTPKTFWVPGESSSFFSSLWKSFREELVSVVTGSSFRPAIVSKTHLFSLPLKVMHNLGGCEKIMMGGK